MESRIETAVERIDGVAVIHITGYLNAAAQEALDTAYAEASADGTTKVVLVFRAEDHINSAGIGSLIGLVMENQNKGASIRLVQPSEHFRKIFDIVGLNRYLEVFSTLEDALGNYP